jgi:signal transduction histidine kinase
MAPVLITGFLLLFGFFGTAPAAANQHVATPPPLAYVLIVAACLPLLLWRIRPLWTLAATSLATLIYLGLGYPYGPIMFTIALAVFGVAWRLPMRRALVAIGTVELATMAMVAVGLLSGHRVPPEFISLSAWLVIPAAIGLVLKARRDARTDVRTEQARRAVSEERLRLAQEVHDVAGHGFAVIAMQAGVALRVLDRDPAAVRAALEGIRAASREALDGLRAEVEAMRSDAPLRPTTGLADLPALADRLRASGLPVELSLSGGDQLPSDVDRAAYRIVQESLTNVLRHAGPGASATVEIGRTDGTLRVAVSNTGPPGSIRPGGRGIDGMRARAEAVGGTLDAAPRPAGGFAVQASLPIGGTE